ncbi:MAG: ABC transporter ATP-binding protein [Candidatus Promineifilaceae bacterium]
MNAEAPPVVQMTGIVKRFPGVLANDRVDLVVQQGEIHALLGENGAGKSTLMNMLSGLYRPDAGEIRINGRLVQFGSPRDAINAGIGMVHQHFMLVPTQTVAENLILGRPYPRFLLNYDHLNQEIAALSRQFGMAVEPSAKIWQLSVGEQQRVEVLKMLYHGAKILIMDEPTAVLTPQEVVDLFHTLRQMAASGHTIIFISHKLDEVMAIADRVTVLRRGQVTAVVETARSSKPELARLMVGREVLFRLQKTPANPGPPLLQLRDITCDNDRGLPALRGLNLTVHAGEVVGLAGVAGNGQTELAEVITGLRPVNGGILTIEGHNLTNQPAVVAIEQGIAHIPADRTGVGSAPNLSLAENLILKSYRTPPISSGWSLNLTTVRQTAATQIAEFDVKAPSIDIPARMLSGGNLQKLILAREFSLQPKAIVAVYPTRGLDVGAIEAVHRLLIQARDNGAAILLISEDLDELLSLSDRIAVIYEGQIAGETPPEDDRIAEIGLLMAGSRIGEQEK